LHRTTKIANFADDLNASKLNYSLCSSDRIYCLKMDFGSSMEYFQEELLICRPRDPFSFAIRYFKDEKLPNPEEAHAVHMLPFLAFNHTQLQSALCTIYCHHTMSGAAPKSWLDSATVLDIYQRMGLNSLKLKVKSVDEVRYF